MGNKSFEKKLKEYQKRLSLYSQKSSAEGKRCNLESNTTIKFVIPLLQILGWDHLSKDMEFEYAVSGRGLVRPRRVDIALYGRDSKRPKVLVEIKRFQTDLGTGCQLRRYLYATRIKHGIYTNGEEIRLISNRTPIKNEPEALFTLKCKDFLNYKDVLAVFSKNSVESGRLDKLVKSYHTKKFWQLLKERKKQIKQSQNKDIKYVSRLELAKELLKSI